MNQFYEQNVDFATDDKRTDRQRGVVAKAALLTEQCRVRGTCGVATRSLSA